MTFTSPLPPGSADVNARGSAFLASLIEFIRPTTPNKDITSLCTSVQGLELLKTLGNFVSLVANSGGDDAGDEQEDISISSEERFRANKRPPKTSISDADEFLLLSNLVDMYPNVEELPTKLIEEVNKNVFNWMPIRMISFDPSGGSCTLVDRSTLVGIILTRIHTAYPEKRALRRKIRDELDLYLLVQDFCKYAILSHTWLRGMPGDVLYQDWEDRALPQNARGNAKIAKFCSVAAREHGVVMGWMDTVCINKESSAELDESIRSMYTWYKGAHVCIAYLADTLEFAEIPNDVWFTRGWTLQELVANHRIHFYNRNWTQLVPGNFEAHLSNPEFILQGADEYDNPMAVEIQYQIFKATSITCRELYFLNLAPHFIPICRIMELAAKRKVTRAEDQVYSLMGLLQSSIAIAYGEGSWSALSRMIQQIMISRSDFRDLFNHTDKYSILPFAITKYIGHAKVVKKPQIAPQEPIVLSHLGVHATFLAIPLFREDEYKNDFPPNVLMSNILWTIDDSRSSIYIALDDSKETSKWASNLNITLPQQKTDMDDLPPFIFLAIFASQVDQDHDKVYIPVGNNIGVPVVPDLLNPSHDPITTQFTDIKPLKSSLYTPYFNYLGPLQINLPYSGLNVSKEGVLTLTGEEAKQLGFRVISAYFP